jgi:hypothetical protein
MHDLIKTAPDNLDVLDCVSAVMSAEANGQTETVEILKAKYPQIAEHKSVYEWSWKKGFLPSDKELFIFQYRIF